MTQNLRLTDTVSSQYSNFSTNPTFNPCVGDLTAGNTYDVHDAMIREVLGRVCGTTTLQLRRAPSQEAVIVQPLLKISALLDGTYQATIQLSQLVLLIVY